MSARMSNAMAEDFGANGSFISIFSGWVLRFLPGRTPRLSVVNLLDIASSQVNLCGARENPGNQKLFFSIFVAFSRSCCWATLGGPQWNGRFSRADRD